MARIPFWQVDAFTDRPFAGNSAAVCLLDGEADAGWMQAVAAEMNLSETSFVRSLDEGHELRWFTPTVEVDLCGHATLATAHALWFAGIVNPSVPLHFQTRSGRLACHRREDLIELDFPALPVTEIDAAPKLLAALGGKPVFLGKSKFDYFVQFERESEVRALAPDFRRLREIDTRGVIVTAPSDERRFDFVSRFFAPAVGIDEDPVCGSAHCSLGPYWGERLGKSELIDHQVSRRTGIIQMRLSGERVVLGGQAVTVLQGELLA